MSFRIALGFAVVGLVLVIAGVLVLWGLGWALLVSGVLVTAGSVFLLPLPSPAGEREPRRIHGVIP